ncbi:response regulator transcription factor, partial [Streptosporangium sp. NPDC001682]
MAERIITLLIVDDHPVVRDGLHGMFAASADFEVLGEASDGAEAVALTARLDPDVVLMDLRMPGGGGVEAIAELADQLFQVDVPVFFTVSSAWKPPDQEF